ncbi:ABC transporter ATP-binding protein [Williamsia soli]|uniref:ABC transporter ATP-binding protein n=1 Tax=Williamsia soli TaxID=364929 RepID=UPI001A9CF98C|nr:ABC transporter ATP-binding protein [Williamsia soli]
MSALVCTGLEAGYFKRSPCVRNVDLTLEAGQVLCLLGPNGAGKTTLLMTLAGLLPRFSGQVSVGDAVIKSGSPRAAVGSGLVLVPDDRALFRGLSVRKNLQLATRGRGRGKQALGEVLDYFPALGARLKVDAGQLSGGEQQMLAIGRALIQQPKVLLIDELSMGLAPVIVESILPILRTVAEQRGTTVVLVEQHIHLALEVADRAAILVHGEIVLEQPAAALRADPGLVERAYLGARKDDSESVVAAADPTN